MKPENSTNINKELESIIQSEYSLYLKRYNYWDTTEQTDDVAKGLVQESERILRNLYRIKYGVSPDENVFQWLAFWKELG